MNKYSTPKINKSNIKYSETNEKNQHNICHTSESGRMVYLHVLFRAHAGGIRYKLKSVHVFQQTRGFFKSCMLLQWLVIA